MKHYLIKVLAGISVLAAFGCASEPKVVEFSENTNPQAELERFDSSYLQAQNKQTDVLSPTNFVAAKKSRDLAFEARAKNKDQKEVLHRIAVADAYLSKAVAVTEASQQSLKTVIDARQDALTARSQQLFPQEMTTEDEKLKKLSSQMEDNDKSKVASESLILETNYRKIEINSIKKDKLGSARQDIKEAILEGAEKLTPDTLLWATNKMVENEKIIEVHSHNFSELARASLDAKAAASRLLKMVRNAKGAVNKNPEDFAKQVEKNEITSNRSARDLSVASEELGDSQNELAAMTEKNEKLNERESSSQKYQNVRSQFSPSEADVYQQGDKILLRLKGMSFSESRSNLDAKDYGILAKVQKVISTLGPGEVVVEGHTDSIGNRQKNEILSMKRAKTVQSYLSASSVETANRITAAGFGDQKPIATNKTSAGRAQNRRVDIVITADKIQE